ncbi:MAG: hypothetical protein LBT41_04295 [Candidatus Methanoplasma sp.]|nr:hypothetical protein [Candidatus Methanoplasma sp.]
MSELRYCPNCGRNTYVEVKINWIIFIVLLICGVLLGLVYLVYCFAAKTKVCEVCKLKANKMEPPRFNSQ